MPITLWDIKSALGAADGDPVAAAQKIRETYAAAGKHRRDGKEPSSSSSSDDDDAAVEGEPQLKRGRVDNDDGPKYIIAPHWAYGRAAWVQFKPQMPFEGWQQYLPQAPYFGSLISKEDVVPNDDADTLYRLVMDQIATDAAISNDWLDPVVDEIEDDIPKVWFKGDINSFGKPFGRVSHRTRLSLNLGEDYVYSGIPNRGVPLAFDHPLINFIREHLIPLVEQQVSETWPYANIPTPGPPNNVLINYYRDQNSNIGAHSDEVEPHMHPATSPVAMLSFGASREWVVTPKKDPRGFVRLPDADKLTFFTNHRQMAVMYEPMQQYWTHGVQAGVARTRARDGRKDRVSLTFRWLRPVDRRPSPRERQSMDERIAIRMQAAREAARLAASGLPIDEQKKALHSLFKSYVDATTVDALIRNATTQL